MNTWELVSFCACFLGLTLLLVGILALLREQKQYRDVWKRIEEERKKTGAWRYPE
jgi:hypothetical protein